MYFATENLNYVQIEFVRIGVFFPDWKNKNLPSSGRHRKFRNDVTAFNETNYCDPSW